ADVRTLMRESGQRSHVDPSIVKKPVAVFGWVSTTDPPCTPLLFQPTSKPAMNVTSLLALKAARAFTRSWPFIMMSPVCGVELTASTYCDPAAMVGFTIGDVNAWLVVLYSLPALVGPAWRVPS